MDAGARTPLYRQISDSLLAGIREVNFPWVAFCRESLSSLIALMPVGTRFGKRYECSRIWG